MRAGHLVGDDKTDPQSQLIAVITTIHQTCLTTFALLAPDHTPPSRCFRVRVSARDTLCLPCRQTDWTDVMRPARSLSSFLGCAPLPRNRTRAPCSPSGGFYRGLSSWQFWCSAQQGRLRRVQGTCPPPPSFVFPVPLGCCVARGDGQTIFPPRSPETHVLQTAHASCRRWKAFRVVDEACSVEAGTEDTQRFKASSASET